MNKLLKKEKVLKKKFHHGENKSLIIICNSFVKSFFWCFHFNSWHVSFLSMRIPFMIKIIKFIFIKIFHISLKIILTIFLFLNYFNFFVSKAFNFFHFFNIFRSIFEHFIFFSNNISKFVSCLCFIFNFLNCNWFSIRSDFCTLRIRLANKLTLTISKIIKIIFKISKTKIFKSTSHLLMNIAKNIITKKISIKILEHLITHCKNITKWICVSSG